MCEYAWLTRNNIYHLLFIKKHKILFNEWNVRGSIIPGKWFHCFEWVSRSDRSELLGRLCCGHNLLLVLNSYWCFKRLLCFGCRFSFWLRSLYWNWKINILSSFNEGHKFSITNTCFNFFASGFLGWVITSTGILREFPSSISFVRRFLFSSTSRSFSFLILSKLTIIFTFLSWSLR